MIIIISGEKANILVEETELTERKKGRRFEKSRFKRCPKSEAEAKDKAKFKALKEAGNNGMVKNYKKKINFYYKIKKILI